MNVSRFIIFALKIQWHPIGNPYHTIPAAWHFLDWNVNERPGNQIALFLAKALPNDFVCSLSEKIPHSLSSRFPVCQICEFRPLRRDCARLSYRRIQQSVSKRRATFFYIILKLKQLQNHTFSYNAKNKSQMYHEFPDF